MNRKLKVLMLVVIFTFFMNGGVYADMQSSNHNINEVVDTTSSQNSPTNEERKEETTSLEDKGELPNNPNDTVMSDDTIVSKEENVSNHEDLNIETTSNDAMLRSVLNGFITSDLDGF